MSGSDKPYRRFRARGGSDDGGDGLDELRRLTREQDDAGAERPKRRDDRPRKEAARQRALRRDRRARSRRDRPWWSFRGLSLGGWVGRVAAALALVVVVWGVLGLSLIHI